MPCWLEQLERGMRNRLDIERVVTAFLDVRRQHHASLDAHLTRAGITPQHLNYLALLGITTSRVSYYGANHPTRETGDET